MRYNVVTIDDIETVSIKAKKFPDGIKEAFEKIENKLNTLKSRKFYGAIITKPTAVEYRACLDAKENELPELEQYKIPGGKYTKVKLMDWQKNAGKIKEIFRQMSEECDIDVSRPFIEFYKSSKELILMSPVK